MSFRKKVENHSFLQKLSGQIEKMIYYNPENGFCIIKLKILGKKELTSVLGILPNASIGEQIEATGKWENNATYGQIFKAQTIEATHPTSLKNIEKYLASGIIRGIGLVFAKKLVKTFGRDIFSIIEQDPEKLLQIEGFTKIKLESLKQNWLEQKTIREVIIFLNNYNVNTSKAIKIYNIYGASSIETIQNNPYLLSQDIKEFDFKIADNIAQNLGMEKDSIIRARAGIKHALTKAMDDGHCGLPNYQLIDLTQKLLNIPDQLIRKALALEISNGEAVKYDLPIQDQELSHHIECIFPKSLADLEQFIANKLKELSEAKKIWDKFKNIDQLIANETQKIGIDLSNAQKNAITQALDSRVMIVTGGPGVGKTTILSIIVKILESKGVQILLAAPTGRAAKRISEVTGMPATTIHRLLKKNVDEDFHSHITLKCDLLIIDEMSMVDVPLMAAILKALPQKAAIFLFGDIDQLSSIGPGKVLEDIIVSNILPVIKLKEIFRQSQLSQIIVNAHKINNGESPCLINSRESDFFFLESSQEEALKLIMGLVKDRLPFKFKISPKDIQIICPMNKGSMGTKNLNEELQKAFITNNDKDIDLISKISCSNLSGTTFYLNDKVMQIINNYDLEVFNGDIGIITGIDQKQKLVTVNYEGKEVNYEYKILDELTLAYAITVHKSQGSEYPIVIIPLFIQHYPMLQKNLLYTAITRGKKLVIIVGERKAITIATENKSQRLRYTSLNERIRRLITIS